MALLSIDTFRRLFGRDKTSAPKSDEFGDGIRHSTVSDEDLTAGAPLYEDERFLPVTFEKRDKEVKWALDHRSPDYAHLKSKGATLREFPLRADDLELLATLNDFPVARLKDTPVLFGLRGCALAKPASGLQQEVTLKDIRPTHGKVGCVIGAWDRVRKLVAVFPASTVPMESIVEAHYEGSSKSGNILPTGYYGYIVGSHCTESGGCRPGCFLLRYENGDKRVVPVRRAKKTNVAPGASSKVIAYDLFDEVDVCAPGDNIHPSFRSNGDSFSSWGCQVVQGNYTNGAHTRPWADFRRAAGMTDDDGDPKRRYDYMLLTGVEAMRASDARLQGKVDDPAFRMSLRRLRFGSEGPAVMALQKALALAAPDGTLGPATCEALNRRQRSLWKKDCDGIYSPDFDQQIGGNVFVVPAVA